ncbi:MAG: hypothetical protein JWQ35_625 [Bacteriovoracaceae bacterium]|nr:hypothetical protein [Bacteriovoracaceae bacterium]
MEKFKKNKWLIVLNLIFIFGFESCGSDKDTNDFKNELVARQVAQTKPVVGLFRGNISRINGDSLGELSIEFVASTKVSSTVSGPFADRQAVFKAGVVQFQSVKTYFSFTEGFYDPTSGDIQAAGVVNRVNGEKATLQLTGNLSGDQIKGTLEIDGSPANNAVFQVSRNAAPGSLESSNLSDSNIDTAQKFISFGADLGDKKLLIKRLSISPEEDFIEPFVSVKLLDVTVIRDGASTTHFANALLNLLDGKLFAQATKTPSDGDLISSNLTCYELNASFEDARGLEPSSKALAGFRCDDFGNRVGDTPVKYRRAN